MNEPELVIVEWIDPCSDAGWHEREDITQAAANRSLTCKTAGWIIDRTDDYILVAGSLRTSEDEADQVGDVFQIPYRVIDNVHPGGVVTPWATSGR